MQFEKWSVEEEQIPFENQWVRVRVQRVRLPEGEAYDYTLVDRPKQGVAVLLFDAEGRLLLEREYRHAVGQALWQLPGGLIDHGEPPLASIQRELKEETGYIAREWRELEQVYDNPALGNAVSYLYVAREPERVADRQWSEAERLEVQWVTLEWLREAIRRGEIVDRVLLSGLAMLWAYGLL